MFYIINKYTHQLHNRVFVDIFFHIFKKFIIPAGGNRMPKSQKTKSITVDKSGNKRTLETIHMDGMGIFAFVNSKL